MPVGFMVREEETDPAFPSLTKADVERRVEDWLQRLERLYRGIAQWADERGWSVDRAQTVEIHEELMRRFAVPARRQPVLRIEDGHSGLLVDTQEEFTDALRRLLTDSELRRRLSSGALEVSHRFTWTQSQRSFAKVVSARLDGRILQADDPGTTRA